jgi:hypothetical protein
MNAFSSLLRVCLFTIVFVSLAAPSSVDPRLFKKEVPAVQKRNKAFTDSLRTKPKSYDLPYSGLSPFKIDAAISRGWENSW